MNFAPMPDHGRVDRPEWQSLWVQYEAVTTPLRAAGLPCDIETCGNQTVITVDLPDGSHLVIASDDALPDHLADVTGWLVTRAHEDNPTIGGVGYNSTEDGENAQRGADIAPLHAAIAVHLTTLPDADTQNAGGALRQVLEDSRALFNVTSLGVSSQHAPTRRLLSGPLDSHSEAVKEYGWQTHFLEEDGWTKVHESGGTQWPVTVWQRRDVVQTVFVARLAR